ncbi:MAG: MCE family protein [Alphaproteobacteria bacterium]|nr:MCE family protein [Alphaproteobacteria bacterium]
MKQEKKEIIAGVILTVLLAGALSFVHSRSVVKDDQNDFTLNAYFSKADGLMNGADVRLAGVKVGTVTQQSLDRGYAVKIRMSFYQPIELSVDSSVSIETDGLLGTKHIEIMPGGDEEMLSSGDDILYTQDALILSDLMDKVNAYMREKKEDKMSDKTQ